MVRIQRSGLLWLACVLPATAAFAAKAPTVSITSPASGATFTAPAAITISATAAVTGGTITRVDFYRGGTTLIGTATAAPYTVTWSGAPAGGYSLTAKATSNAGLVTTSAAVNITVNTQPPAVSLTAPANGATYTAPATITLGANASDPDGTVQRVDFYSGSSLIGSSSTPPFAATWSGVGAGTYTLTAKATDNAGAQATSAPVTVSVGALNVPPLVAITSPGDCGPFRSGSAIFLSADAVDPDGLIRRVEFYQGDTLIGSVNNPNVYADTRNAFGINWTPGAGTYTLSATAYDNKGAATTSAPFTLTVSEPPSVSIAAPTNGSTWSIGVPVAITASATGSIARVDFYVGGGLVGSATSPPYSVTWTPSAAGSYPIFATAIDSAGFSTTSSQIVVMVDSPPPPSVSITAPQEGASVVAHQPLALAASATPGASSIVKVEFYTGSTRVSTATAAPYTGSWIPTVAGQYSLVAVATDALGLTGMSSPVSITVTASPPPAVSLTPPAGGASLIVNRSVSLNATASAGGSATIARVDFYAGAVLVGTSTAAPFSATWTPTAAGTYLLTARATDTFNVSATSAPVGVGVEAGPPPVVTLTSPATGSTFSNSGTVTLSASAAPAPGGAAIAQVAFFRGSTFIGASSAPPYTVSWPSPPVGTYSLTAVATDVLGITAASAPISVTIINSPPPSVSLASPTAGSVYAAPAGVTLVASVSAASGASIVRVDFYQGGALLGAVTSPPYLYAWTGAPAGNYSLTAVATDSLGVQAASPPINVTVSNLSLAFTSPQDGAAVSGSTVLVQGTVQAPPNSGVTVNGVVAMVDANNKFYAEVPLAAGNNPISATVTAPAGQSFVRSIAVSSDGVEHFLSITVSEMEGVSPLPVAYTLANTGTTEAAVSFNGSPAGSLPAGETVQFSVSYTGTGAVFTTISATNGAGGSMSRTFVTLLDSPGQLDQKLKAVWNGMNNALALGDKPTALSYLSASAQATYDPVFDALMPSMPEIVASFSTPQVGQAGPRLAEYAVTRNLDGVNNVFFLYFIKDENGVWRLDSM